MERIHNNYVQWVKYALYLGIDTRFSIFFSRFLRENENFAK